MYVCILAYRSCSAIKKYTVVDCRLFVLLAYYFDGDDFDNIRWMVGDIAVVKVEDNFNFERRIRGCDFIPKKVDFNNRSADYEKARQVGTIAGWGTTERFGDVSILTLLEVD